MYITKTSRHFDKEFKRCLKRGCNPALFREVILLLSETGTLPQQYHPHKLSGNYANLWECHIQADWLLIWEQNDNELILVLTNTGTHSDLFK